MSAVACSTTVYGCCPNGVDPALGPNYAGCESVSPTDCASAHYGCCPDGTSTAEGPDFAGCPSTMAFNQSDSECAESAYGCCEDGVTAAYGPHFSGCPQRIKHGGILFVDISRLKNSHHRNNQQLIGSNNRGIEQTFIICGLVQQLVSVESQSAYGNLCTHQTTAAVICIICMHVQHLYIGLLTAALLFVVYLTVPTSSICK